jgi:hypothetical protein
MSSKNESFTDDKIYQIKQKKWRLGIQNSISFMFAKSGYYEIELIPEELENNALTDFFKQSRKCFTFSTDAHRMFSNKWGIGIKYSFLSNCDEDFISFNSTDGIGIVSTDVINRLYINYIGASAFLKFPLVHTKALFLHTAISIGYTHYRNEFETDLSSQYFTENTLSTGSSVGGNIELGIEYFLTSWLSVSFGTDCFISKFNKLSVKRGREPKQSITFKGDDKRNVSHIDIYVGLRLHL